MRRSRIAVVAATVGVLAVASLAAPAGGAETAGASASADGSSRAGPPNVVLVVMDDMRLDDVAWMPRTVRRVAVAGARYRNYYTPMALCCPARASILRGQYPHNTGIVTNAEPDGGYQGSRNIDDSTIATWLERPYTTGYVGKYFNGYEGPRQRYVPPGWDDWMGTIDTYGYVNTVTNDNGRVVSNKGTNSPEVFASQAKSFITEQSATGSPFFLHLSFVTPHNGGPHRDGDHGLPSPFVPRRDRGTYDGPEHPTGPAYDEREIEDKTGPVARLPRLSDRQEWEIAVKFEQRRESLASADRAMGRVLDTLEATGEMRDTYVIFTSDNGFVLGEHRLEDGKRQPYEPASHLPLFIRGPGIPSGRVWKGPVGTQDIAPTILDIAGVGPPAGVDLDGHSVLPTAGRVDDDRERAIVLEGAAVPVDAENGGRIKYAAPQTIAETDWIYRGLATERWKYVEWEQLGTVELYDLAADPHEVRNLSEDPAYAKRRAELAARLAQLRDCAGVTCE